ncbi:hypothetical protein TNCV_885281 [Trichonephila clavipes]|uniref:Uncharacterized protein n=2 Tax=Trichonephila TaxID=2585208 RepID=A0A8X6L4F7_TRICU|nr:hypothetical protein TNCT_646021 [Trichonephila clavata]GFV25062.1 hypothetical protein TNCV_885281 [Trichonephila clavipes]GFY52495.1 hypothetical protein TNIN_168851 [Trichonephila inaurata madagascariensis]
METSGCPINLALHPNLIDALALPIKESPNLGRLDFSECLLMNKTRGVMFLGTEAIRSRVEEDKNKKEAHPS